MESKDVLGSHGLRRQRDLSTQCGATSFLRSSHIPDDPNPASGKSDSSRRRPHTSGWRSGCSRIKQEARELILRNLNDFALRDQIQRETSGLREILAAAALRGAGV